MGRAPNRAFLLREYVELGCALSLVGGLLVALASCANPRPPSGGPQDDTPPSIAETRPVRDTVNVPTDTRSVYVEFSEYVERTTLRQALSITPSFEQRLQFSWSGRGVTIEFPESLRDSTTYLLTFDTNLSDAHGVSLDDPLTVAFSTGPRIARGEIRGRVVEPQEGSAQSGVDVYAYVVSDAAAEPPTPLPDRPTYRTQTGQDGSFAFSYMREQLYFVVALRDNNRNRRPDPSEAVAVPPRVALEADSAQAEVPVPWLLARRDTVAPRLQQAQSLSRQRVRLTFSEPIQLSSRRPGDWVLRDSVADDPVGVQSVYRPPDRSDAVVLRTAPMENVRHTLPLTSAIVEDTLGHGLVQDTARFQAVSRTDTAQTRFRSFVPQDLVPDSAGVYPLLPEWQPGVRFNQAPDTSRFVEAVALRDTTGASRPHSLTSEDGRTFRFQPDSALAPGSFVDVVVDGRAFAGPDSTYRRRFRRVTDRVLGELEGRALVADTTGGVSFSETEGTHVGPDPAAPESDSGSVDTTSAAADSVASEGPLVVELIPTQSAFPLEGRRQTVAPGSTFVFRELPEGTFRFRAFQDRNGNEQWDEGQIQPYTPSEPIMWSQQTIDSRPRWTTALPAPLRIPVLRSEEAPVSAPDTAAVDSLN